MTKKETSKIKEPAKEKKKNGRPKKIIDYKTVEQLASIMCTQEEIASILEISVRTLQRDAKFCRIYKKGLDKGRMSLRRKQFSMSDRNATMAIWLGKQYLGQTDKITNVAAEDKLSDFFDKLEEGL